MKPLLIMSATKCWIDKLRDERIESYNAFTDLPIVFRALRKLFLLYDLPFCSIWFGKWKYEVKKYDTVILFANKMHLPILFWLKKHYPSLRVIFWYWNPVVSCVSPNSVSEKLCETWSFDEADCKHYMLNKNTTFYVNSFLNIRDENIIFDIFFVGEDKGRLSDLLNIEIQFKEIGLKTYFHIVNSKYGSKMKKDEVFKLPISYNEVLKYIKSSRAILELVQKKQSGFTLRTMEALFFKKKLITNNVNIKESDFYNKANIFILGYDNMNLLSEFILTPYVNVPDNIVERYSVHKWLERFG